MRRWLFAVAVLALASFVAAEGAGARTIRIGSKTFTESYLLGEMIAQKLEKASGIEVQRKLGLGSTMICFEAIRSGEIDAYPDYTGTLLRAVLKSSKAKSFETLKRALESRYGLTLSAPLGFNNTYAIAMKRERANELGVKRLSELFAHPSVSQLRWGVTHEFIKREDGLLKLLSFYGAPKIEYKGMEHSLVYQAIDHGEIDVIDAYSTDGNLAKYDLGVLQDDREFFPLYEGVFVIRQTILEEYPAVVKVLESMAGQLSNKVMRHLNAKVDVDKLSYASVVRAYRDSKEVKSTLGIGASESAATGFFSHELLARLKEHVGLTAVSVLLSTLVGILLGLLIYRYRVLVKPVLSLVGIIQTIPSIALLAFMIPLFGIGPLPAVLALFLYGLLPIVRNTFAGLNEIQPRLLDAAYGIGLSRIQVMRMIELPLAIRVIVSGVRTSAVISVGTATLAAFIGAGGLGDFIITGLNLNDTSIILQGAIPAAMLAIVVELGLGGIERMVTPLGLKLAMRS